MPASALYSIELFYVRIPYTITLYYASDMLFLYNKECYKDLVFKLGDIYGRERLF
jgi:hypothetical protein